MWVTRLEGWVNQKNPCFGKIVQIVIRASLISLFSVTHVEKANEALAIKTLLVTNELFRSEMKNNDILVQFEKCNISIQLIFILKEHVFPFCFVVENRPRI